MPAIRKRRTSATQKAPAKRKQPAKAVEEHQEEEEEKPFVEAEHIPLRRSPRKRSTAKAPELKEEPEEKKPPRKRARTTSPAPPETGAHPTELREYKRQAGTIERGHIYFFYRPKVQHEEAHSIDDVRNMHMVLIPRPPAYLAEAQAEAAQATGGAKKEEETKESMAVLAPGADVIPAALGPEENPLKQKYRVITIGKKQLPVPKAGKGGTEEGSAAERTIQSRRRGVFWATITSIGEDIESLKKALGERTYETKTRGTRFEAAARMAARGAYAIVNNEPDVPSRRRSILAFYISHPHTLGKVQRELGLIDPAESFMIQMKNPLAPARGLRLPKGGAEYPIELMRSVFGTDKVLLREMQAFREKRDRGELGKGREGEGEGKVEDEAEHMAEFESQKEQEYLASAETDTEEELEGEDEQQTRGREMYGLRFVSCERAEMLDYPKAQMIIIADHAGLARVEETIGEERGEALKALEEKEAREESLKEVFAELGMEAGKVPDQPMEGKWF